MRTCLPPPAGLIKLFNRNEDMIATVVGHECAHAVARHSSEKLSLGLFIALAVQVRDKHCTCSCTAHMASCFVLACTQTVR
jgi:predicted Zn-dependent protease